MLKQADAPIPQYSVTKRFFRWWAIFCDLFFIRWSNIRNEWYFHVILGPIFPLALLFFMRLLGAVPTPEKALYFAAGNAILALVLGPMQSLANDLAIARQRHDLEFFATLPFAKLQLILAYSTVTSLPTIPIMAITITVASFFFGFQVTFNPFIIIIMLAAGISMAGVGAVIGTYARNIHHANMLNSLGMMVVTFMSPVLIPRENLPVVLQWTSRLLPPSYAADGLRAALQGNLGRELWFNIIMLFCFIFLFLFIATKKLDWRDN